jgi:hypothetical protein
MKTAMQELLDELDLMKIVEKHDFFMVKYIIEQCLEKERQQIIDAYRISGINNYDEKKWPNLSIEYFQYSAEQFFEKHYK